MNQKVKPDWAGDDALSRFVNLLIQNKPIFGVMKSQARRVIIKKAEKNGVEWRENYKALEQEMAVVGVEKALSESANPDITYPDYYQVPFHAYDEGNLCWPAALEAESATYAMALRIWPEEGLTDQVAQDRLRASFHKVLAEYGPQQVTDILDVGCSVGISTRSLHEYYTQKSDESPQNTSVNTVGLDLSPYMLAVAKQHNEDTPIQWRHAKAEDTGLSADSFDVVTLQYVIHELPRHITQAIFTEAHRILRSGGCIALVDNDPKSPVIQGLPPVLFTLMKSTEPWSDDYYTFNVEAALEDSGFEHTATVSINPRHRTIVGIKR